MVCIRKIHYYATQFRLQPGKMKYLLLSIAFFSCSLHFVQGQVKSVPDFTFSRLDNGAEFKSANLVAGKKTLFVFFDTECSHCMQAITEYNSKEKMLNNINIVLITRDPKSDVQAFLKKYGPILSVKKNTTILFDKNNQFIGKFLPRKFPSMFLFDASKRLMIYSDEEKDIPVIFQMISSK
jgi:thiol-disulfide isomerase/thioredoxin